MAVVVSIYPQIWRKHPGLLNCRIAGSGFTSPSTTQSACTFRLLWKTATFPCADGRLGWLPVRESVRRCFCTACRRASREQFRLAPFSLGHLLSKAIHPIQRGSPQLSLASHNSRACIPLCRLAATCDISWPRSAMPLALLNADNRISGMSHNE